MRMSLMRICLMRMCPMRMHLHADNGHRCDFQTLRSRQMHAFKNRSFHSKCGILSQVSTFLDFPTGWSVSLNLLRYNDVPRTSRIFGKIAIVFSVLIILKYNPGKRNNKFITSWYISIQWYADEFKKKTNYCIRFGHSLWSADQLLAQEVRHDQTLHSQWFRFCKYLKILKNVLFYYVRIVDVYNRLRLILVGNRVLSSMLPTVTPTCLDQERSSRDHGSPFPRRMKWKPWSRLE